MSKKYNPGERQEDRVTVMLFYGSDSTEWASDNRIVTVRRMRTLICATNARKTRCFVGRADLFTTGTSAGTALLAQNLAGLVGGVQTAR
ncbi:MAG: hypothetical protein ACYDH4_02930 [Candidatus Cryosericum sp.]